MYRLSYPFFVQFEYLSCFTLYFTVQPFQAGSTTLESDVNISGVFCKTIQLNPSNFLPAQSSPLKILLSTSWSSSSQRIEASASWSENVQEDSFRACTLVAGRHPVDYFQSPPIVQWIVFQNQFFHDDKYIQSGSTTLDTWYTGSQCKFVTYTMSPENHVYVSVSHSKPKVYSNAMTVWAEIRNLFQVFVCARELQNFDGVHKGVIIVSCSLLLLNEV